MSHRNTYTGINAYTHLPPHPHTLFDLPTETLKATGTNISHQLSGVKRRNLRRSLCWIPLWLHTVCPHILSVEKGREGAPFQSHSSALPARSRRACQRETHSESQKVPASLSASTPCLYVCLPLCLGFTLSIWPPYPKPFSKSRVSCLSSDNRFLIFTNRLPSLSPVCHLLV